MEVSRVWEQKAKVWRPWVTYVLLGTMFVFWVAERFVFAQSIAEGERLFVIRSDRVLWMESLVPTWIVEPWTLVTSTLSHDPISVMHLLFNGLFLFFFGPLVERLAGPRRMLVLFFVAGALTGIAQVEISLAFGGGHGALGASGALMAMFGLIMVLLPREKILLWGIVPIPMWAAGIGYAALDLVGALNPQSDVGNFAHLAGLALGLLYGIQFRNTIRRRGLRIVHT